MLKDKNNIQHKKSFESFYINWYSRMKSFAQYYVGSEADAENIVQDVFLKLYENDILSDESVNATAYLFLSVKNRCLNFLEHKIIEQEAVSKIQNEIESTFKLQRDTLSGLNMSPFSEDDIDMIVDNAIDQLPDKCREVFIMNKFKGIKQKDIAQKLGITVNTVESQMAIAYKKLKSALLEYVKN